jgi:hypothetical protein
MGFYNDALSCRGYVTLAMRNKHMLPYRERVIGGTEGRVLEIGIGSGLNLPFYRNIREVIGLESAPRLIAVARRAAQSTPTPAFFLREKWDCGQLTPGLARFREQRAYKQGRSF